MEIEEREENVVEGGEGVEDLGWREMKLIKCGVELGDMCEANTSVLAVGLRAVFERLDAQLFDGVPARLIHPCGVRQFVEMNNACMHSDTTVQTLNATASSLN
jgi:hypothetical protein